ncbi:MAG: glycosyltransferase [Oscillochloris sp.]|nr:glycosyltransferase [Oscillochloris sp.]
MPSKRTIPDPSVSVIIPTRNSARFLAECLNSILNQSFPAAEIIVCDNNSTDETVALAHQFSTTVLHAGPERSAQRNIAARQARGDALLFIDSDMRLSRDVILSCVQHWRTGANTIIIPEVVIGNRLWAKARALDKCFGAGVPGYEAARFVDRKLFLAVGGYDEQLIVGEDFDLHMSLVDRGGIEGHITTPIEHLEYDLTLKDYIHKWRYYAKHLPPFIAKRGSARYYVPTLPRLVLQRWRVATGDPLGFVSFVTLKLIEYAVIGRQMRQGARAMKYRLSDADSYRNS